MALNAWTLLGQLGFDTTDFDKGLEGAEKKAKQAAGTLEKDLGGAAATAAGKLDGTAKAAGSVAKVLSGPEVKEAARDARKLADEHKAGLRPLKEVKDALEEQERNLKATAAAQDKNSQEYRETVTALTAVRRELDATNNSLKQQAFDFEKLGGQLTKFGRNLSIGVTAPLTLLAGTSVNLAMELETFSTSLNILIGDAERAKPVFDDLYEFSATSPFNWESLTDATRTLAAFGIEAESIVGTLGMLGDVAAGTQSRIEDLAQIYGRVQVTGRAGMEEINRLADRGIPVYTALAERLNVTAAEVRDLVTAGKIGFPEIEQLFQDLTTAGGQFHGMMEEISGTTEGRLNTLLDSFGAVQDVIGQYLLPTFSKLIDLGQQAADWFLNLDEGAQGFAVALGAVLAATGPLLLAAGGIVRMAPQIIAFFNALRVALIPLGGPAGLITVLAVAVGALALAFSGGDKSLDRALGKVSEALASKDKDSITAALDDVITQVDGPVKTVFEELRAELVETGDVGVEQMQRISRAAEMAAQLMAAQRRVQEAEARLADARAIEETFRISGTARDADGGLVFDSARQRANLNQALAGAMESAVIPLIELGADNQFRFTDRALAEQAALNIELVETLMQRMSGPIQEISAAIENSGLSAEAQGELAQAQADLAEVLRYINEGAPTTSPGRAVPPPAPPPTPTTGAAPEEEETVSTSRRAEREAARIRRAQLEYQESRQKAEEALEARAARRQERERERELRNVREAALEYQNSRIAAHEAVIAANQAADERASELAATRAEREQQRIINAQLEVQESRRRSEERMAERAARREEREQQNIINAQLEYQESRIAGIAQAEAREARRHERELANIRAAQLEYQESRVAGIAQAEAREQRRHERELENIRQAALEYQRSRIAAHEAAEAAAARIEERNIINAQLEVQESRRRAWEAANAVDLTGPGNQPTAVITPDRSHLSSDDLNNILAEEMKARRAMVDQLISFTTEDGPLAALGAGIANLVANSIPLLGTAIEGFVQGGPIGAAVAVFTELLSRTESFSEIMAALDGILDPIVAALDMLLGALMPIITVAINLVQGALQPLALIIEHVLAPVITFVAGLIAGIYNAVARAINFALGWLGVKLPLIDLETGRNQEEPGRQRGLLEELQAEREKLLKQISEATSEQELANLNRRLAEVDAEIARLRGLGIDDQTGTEDPGTGPDEREPWVFTGTSQTIQFAVATPLVEAAQEMLLAATTMRDTFAGPTGSGDTISDFTGALMAATPVLERLAEQGIRVDVGMLGTDTSDYTAVGALR